jgi:hypothetical protein
MNTTLFAGFVAGLLGGFLGAYVLVHAERSSVQYSSGTATTPHAPQVLAAHRIQLMDSAGKLRAELAMSVDGGPALFFFDSAGRNRMVLGLYSQAEGEAPSVVLNDTQQHAAGIFRLYGDRDVPVVVLKNQGRDRSIYGLNPTSTEPFIANYAADGKKSEVFGTY